jgi:hypothetical protein
MAFHPEEVARRKGFEPLTPRFEVWCSIQLSYRRRVEKWLKKFKFATRDLLHQTPDREQARDNKTSPRHGHGYRVRPDLYRPTFYQSHEVKDCDDRKDQRGNGYVSGHLSSSLSGPGTKRQYSASS